MKRHHCFVRLSLPTLLVTTALLSGCGWMHRDRVEYYKGASETRPLEVPPDLDAPATSKALVVPGPAAASSPVPTAGNSAAAVPAVASPPSAVDATELRVADSVDSTWQRVGLALERAQIGKVTAKDEAGRSYAFEFEGSLASTAAPTEHHWYSRVIHPFGGDKAKSQSVKSALRINVSDDNGGARVIVSGKSDDKAATPASRRVIEALRERLS